MDLVALAVVFVVGYLGGRLTSRLSALAGAVALALFLLGVAAPDSALGAVESLLAGVYAGNEFLFLSGFLFGVSGGRVVVRRSRRALSRQRG